MAYKQNITAFMSLTTNKAHPFFMLAEWCYVGEQHYFHIEPTFKKVKLSSHIGNALAFCTQGHRLFIFNM